MGLVQVKQDQLAARLAGLALPTGCDTARADAVARLQAMGLPGKRDEYWRYTDPGSLVTPEPHQAAAFDDGDEHGAKIKADRFP